MAALVTVPHGTKGFDCDFTISLVLATAMHLRGFRFAARYVRRGQAHAYDVTSDEVATLHRAGLAAMFVQHVEPEGWEPTLQKGIRYGAVAANELLLLKVPGGTPVFLDLEGVASHVEQPTVDAYARAWHRTVKEAGFRPCLYVGDSCGLDARALYRLPFTCYWAAYNLNSDQYPQYVGVQMQQRAAHTDDVPSSIIRDRTLIDVDDVHRDSLGRLPIALAPDEWDVTI